MPDPKEKINLGEVDPAYRKKLLKGQFSFSDKEKAGMKKEGVSEKEIGEKETTAAGKQELSRQQGAEHEQKEAEPEMSVRKPSFDEFKAGQEAQFEEEATKARKELEAAYRQENNKESGEEKEAVL
jgi:hypothetical protein